MGRIVFTSQSPANLPELRAAAARLRKEGYIVTDIGWVLHPTREAALANRITEDAIADAELVATANTFWAVKL